MVPSLLQAWVLAARPKTLPASIAPILLGTALAVSEGFFDAWVFALALICALSLQIAVNLANDLFDVEKGVDTQERLGPLRGLQLGLIQPGQLKAALAVVLGLATITGLLLAALVSWWLLAFGLASLIAALAYSGGPWPLASHALGEVTVLIFFGWLAVMGSYFIHTQNLTLESFVYATLVGLLSAAIMLVNNLRDRYTDAAAGKHTLVVLLGERNSRLLYRLLLLFLPVLHLSQNPILSLEAWLPLLFSAPLWGLLLVRAGHCEGREWNKQLAQTAALLLIYALSHSLLLVSVAFSSQ